jgi:hypothetical protein
MPDEEELDEIILDLKNLLKRCVQECETLLDQPGPEGDRARALKEAVPRIMKEISEIESMQHTRALADSLAAIRKLMLAAEELAPPGVRAPAHKVNPPIEEQGTGINWPVAFAIAGLGVIVAIGAFAKLRR